MPKQVAPVPAAPVSNSQQVLYISVKTFDGPTGKTIGERVVDMYHYGTRTWLQKHLWWAMCNGHAVETTPASPDEIDAYLETGRQALAEKFNHTAEAVAEVVEPEAKAA